jgi:hypothetical protein
VDSVVWPQLFLEYRRFDLRVYLHIYIYMCVCVCNVLGLFCLQSGYYCAYMHLASSVYVVFMCVFNFVCSSMHISYHFILEGAYGSIRNDSSLEKKHSN